MRRFSKGSGSMDDWFGGWIEEAFGSLAVKAAKS
jgi:hypothetical protein